MTKSFERLFSLVWCGHAVAFLVIGVCFAMRLLMIEPPTGGLSLPFNSGTIYRNGYQTRLLSSSGWQTTGEKPNPDLPFEPSFLGRVINALVAFIALAVSGVLNGLVASTLTCVGLFLWAKLRKSAPRDV